MTRLLVLLLLAALVVLQVRLWIGDGGWREVEQLDAAVATQRRENARLQQRNEALSAEVADLKQGQAAVEERARAELGMIKPDETFFRVVEPAAAAAAAQPGPEQADDEESQ